ncbi:MAG: PKD domain-containing protein [Candidatus Bipolaricaulota bacterium]|nr:PKD domain-containing protein [Candidatus Bipolaricaulota bacterium]
MSQKWRTLSLGLVIVLSAVSCAPIGPNTPPVASFSADPEGGYAPLHIRLDAAGSLDPDGSIRAYNWGFGDGTSAVKGVECVHDYDDEGVYTVSLSVRDDRGGESTTSRHVTVLNPAPVPVVEATVWYGTSPLAVSFDAEASYDLSGEIVAWAWDFGDGETATGQDVDHTFVVASPRAFTVTLTLTDDDGAQGRASVTVRVVSDGTTNAPPVVHFAAIPMSGIAPLAVSFDAAASSDEDGHVVTYAWAFGDGTVGAGVAVQHTFLAPGTYSVGLSVTDDEGASSTVSQYIVVSALIPEPPPPPG